MNASIVWLASYPKSGNTWVRIFLSTYLTGADETCDLNRLTVGTIVSSRKLFEDHTGLVSSELSSAEIDGLRPAVYREIARQSTRPAFMKVHDAYRAPGGLPLFPIEITAATIYLIRNPLDVAVSFAHQNGRSMREAVAALCNSNHRLGAPFGVQLPQHMGSWSDHVRSWESSPLQPTVFRYEDLLENPIDSFARLVRTTGLPLDRQRLKRALEMCAFDRLRRHEEERGFKERPADASGPFFRSGTVGRWRAHLDDDLKAVLVTAHASTMQRHGYLTTTGELTV